METGIDQSSTKAFKRAYNRWIFLTDIEEHKLPEICFKRVCKLDQEGNSSLKFNWPSQFKFWLESVGEKYAWSRHWAYPEVIYSERTGILSEWSSNLFCKAIDRVINSKYNEMFRKLSHLDSIEAYLQFQRILTNVRIVSQYFNGVYGFDANQICSLYNGIEYEDLAHILLKPIRAISDIGTITHQNYVFKYIYKRLE